MKKCEYLKLKMTEINERKQYQVLDSFNCESSYLQAKVTGVI